MSRHPQFEYEYPSNQEHTYYIDDHEGFAADYSDSDCIPDTTRQNLHTIPAPPHLSEMYGKNSTIVPVKVVPYKKASKIISKQQSEQFIQESYCDRNLINASSISAYPDMFNPTRGFYPVSTASQHDASYGTKAFRSAYHNVEQFEQYNCQNCQQSKSMNSKRLPITVRTPKYYKKSQTTGVFKRPSALCLPVAVQPDPAVIRRPKKTVLTENVYGMQETQGMNPITDTPSRTMLRQMSEQEFPHRVDSQGDLNTSAKSAKIPPFDDFIEQMEKSNFKTKKDIKPDMTKMTRFFKPRIPATIRARQEKAKAKAIPVNKKTNVEKANNASKKQNCKNTAEVAQVSLEKLLNQLKKCELSTNKGTPKIESDDIKTRTKQNKNKKEDGDEKSDVTDEEKFDLGSFNYQDITQNLFKSRSDFKENSESVASIQDITKKLTSSTVRPQQLSPMKPLDDHCALELHKSKSYIVNLIDRALSKELGTIPGDRNRKEFEAMNPKKAVETVNRHLGKSERDVSVEITTALTDSIISNATSQEIDEEREEKCSKEKFCCCISNTEEPIYIKQLKQLRWGHLKHIQREVKRLEDLERFLDSCSITTIPEL